MSFERLNIKNMKGYKPGEQIEGPDVIKLNTNENPYPASPAVAAALKNLDTESLRRYPPPLADSFRKAAAKLNNVTEENIIPTKGGDELLRLAITTFVDTDEKIVVTQPSYTLYPVLTDVQGCVLIEVPLQHDWSMPSDFEDYLNSSGAKMCILVNPHAPTGRLLEANYLSQLADSFQGILVIDEAYVDFVDPKFQYNSVPLIKSKDNVLILRSLSKGYSLAGLRFGYGIGAQSLLKPMIYKTRDSYNTDTVAQRLATAALESVDYARGTWDRVRKSRASLTDGLKQIGLNTVPSQSNFVFCQVPSPINAKDLYEGLKQRNILVRYFDQDGLKNNLRISVGSDSENAVLLEAIRSLINTPDLD